MKLYATVTSERASKGQGGNEFLDIQIKAEKLNGIPTRANVIQLLVKNDGGDLVVNLLNYSTGEWLEIIGKGKRQKGEE